MIYYLIEYSNYIISYLVFGFALALSCRKAAKSQVTESTVRYPWYVEIFTLGVFTVFWPIIGISILIVAIRNTFFHKENK